MINVFKLDDKPREYRDDIIEVYPGFYVVPETNFIPVSKNGEILAKFEDGEPKIVLGTVHNNTGYKRKSKSYRYFSERGGRGYWNVHQLIAITFLKRPSDSKKMIVNHINNDGTDNRLDNLEWVSYRDNNIHGHASGFNRSSIPIIIKNLYTNDATEYFSMNIASDTLGWHNGSMHSYLRMTNRNVPYRGHFSITYKNEPIRNYAELGLFGKGIHNRNVVIHTRKNKFNNSRIDVYPNVEKAMMENPKYDRFPVVTDEVIFDYLHNHISEPDIGNHYHRMNIRHDLLKKDNSARNKVPPYRVKVTDIKTKHITEYDSIDDFAKANQFPIHGTRRGVWKNEGYYRGYFVEKIPRIKTGRKKRLKLKPYTRKD